MKMLSVIVLLLVALAVSADNQCSRGESYWCSDIRIAKRCGAVQHCVDTVWKNNAAAKDQTDVCQFCKAIVLDVKNLITDKKAQEEIKTFLDSACTVIPNQQVAVQCKDVVDNYLPEVLMLIETFTDPAVVCSALGICSGFKDQAPHPDDIHIKKEPICGDCKKFIGDVRDLITDKTTEDEVKSLLKQQLCSMLGTLASSCNDIVDAYTPELLKLLSQQVEPEVLCGALGVCDGDRTLLARMRIQKSPLYLEALKMCSDATCIICKTVLTDVQVLIRDPAIQLDLQSFLVNNVCNQLGTLKSACAETVKTYAKTIFEIIVNEVDPETRCKAFGLCSCASSVSNNEDLVHVPLTKVTTNVKVMTDVKSNVSPQCVLCEFVIKELDSLLTDNATEEEIMAALDKVCSIMPDTIKKSCLDFVGSYGPAILALLKQELDPEQVCTVLGLCSQRNVAVHPMPMLLAKPSPLKYEADPATCAVCETVMAYVESLLKENSTETEIEQLLEKVCNFLPKNIQEECSSLIETYGKQIIELIVKSASPKDICTKIGLCSASEVKPSPGKQSRPLLGEKPCTRGPGYWCSSMDTATECKMVDYCKRTAWARK